MQSRRFFGAASPVVLWVAAALLAACATHVTIDPATPPSPLALDQVLIARGAQLAALGNCATCHTADGGRPYAGGYPVKTPFGTVYGTNITPEPDTGIGRWSLAAFERAMREGLDRQGRHLYPAFPYDHFAKLTHDDIRALYAFLLTREPVRAEAPANSVIVPRPFVAVWKAMYLRRAVFEPDPARDATWNRGAYLAEGLAHCGACHTPRNRLGAEELSEHFSGGEVDGWHAGAERGFALAGAMDDRSDDGVFAHRCCRSACGARRPDDPGHSQSLGGRRRRCARDRRLHRLARFALRSRAPRARPPGAGDAARSTRVRKRRCGLEAGCRHLRGRLCRLP
jgi:mono/diheme cytochrome c family protein